MKAVFSVLVAILLTACATHSPRRSESQACLDLAIA